VRQDEFAEEEDGGSSGAAHSLEMSRIKEFLTRNCQLSQVS
jgi:hypothetical protein